MNKLAMTVKKLREQKHMSQATLAKKAGVASGTIGDIETGRNKSTVKTINKIAEALELDSKQKTKLDEAFLGRPITAYEHKIISQIKDLRKNDNDLLKKIKSLDFEEQKIIEMVVNGLLAKK